MPKRMVTVRCRQYQATENAGLAPIRGWSLGQPCKCAGSGIDLIRVFSVRVAYSRSWLPAVQMDTERDQMALSGGWQRLLARAPKGAGVAHDMVGSEHE